ncbi:hypothetical protein CPB86DRAFT_501697 [Serendipita vermifera]|nr:hypothetical protein CPB86DRAFT_501697 [Serendipita vermifera]
MVAWAAWTTALLILMVKRGFKLVRWRQTTSFVGQLVSRNDDVTRNAACISMTPNSQYRRPAHCICIITGCKYILLPYNKLFVL